MIKDTELCKETYEMTKEELAAYAKAQSEAKKALAEIVGFIKRELSVLGEFTKKVAAILPEEKEVIKGIEQSITFTRKIIPTLEKKEESLEFGELLHSNLYTSQIWIDKCEHALKIIDRSSNGKRVESFCQILKTEDGKSDMRDQVRNLIPKTFINTNTNKAIKLLEKQARKAAKKALFKESAPKGSFNPQVPVQNLRSYAEKFDFVRLTMTRCHKNYIEATVKAIDLKKEGDIDGYKKLWDKATCLNNKVIDQPWAREMVVEDEYGLPVFDHNGLVKFNLVAVTDEKLDIAEACINKERKIINVVAAELGK